MYTPTVIFIYYVIIIIAALFVFVDYKIYVNTPHSVRINWPAWRYLPGGAIIAYYKYHNLE